jgi:hypothetical protein
MEYEMLKYDPNGLLDAVIAKHKLKNDAAIARFLGVAPPVISKTRGFTLPVGPTMILKLHEIAGMEVPAIRAFVGGAA